MSHSIMSAALNPVAGDQRVLFVGCASPEQESLRASFEAKGFRADAVGSIEQVCKRLAVLPPSAVILDATSIEGEAARGHCHQLLAGRQAGTAPWPLVLLADGAHLDSIADLLSRGVVDYLVRPFSAERLIERVWVALLTTGQAGQCNKPTPAAGPGVGPHVGMAAIPRRDPDRERCHSAGRGAAAPLPEHPSPEHGILGQSAAIQRVIEQVRLVAPRGTTVLISGETGTGKERVARAIHVLSRRANREMVSVNCGGIPATLLEDEFFGHVKGAFTDAHQARVGRFEQAQGGNIFLDEIGDLPLELQPKLLRVLQEREIRRVGGSDTLRVDARVIAATNIDLWSRVAEGTFREDLFYRINVFPIHLPPLRERREDIPLFLRYFLERFCRRDGLAPKVLDSGAESTLMSRPWPGNIRELENAVEIAVIRSQDRERLTIEDFPQPRPAPRRESLAALETGPVLDFKGLVQEFERGLIGRVLEQTQGNRTQAAEVLRLKRTTLIEKLKKFENVPATALQD
jgi:DNA-binding NtrC family response regulator